MKNKHNAGFTLVESLVAIAILGILTVPTCSALVLAMKMNSRAGDLLDAKLAVSSAVEELKAKGISSTADTAGDDVTVSITELTGKNYYKVVVSSEDDLVTVTTYIRSAQEGGDGTA